MNERERVIQICRDLNIHHEFYQINGSGSLVMHGLRRTRPMGDLDIFCATRTWFDLLSGLHEYNGIRPAWSIFTTDPNDTKRRADPPYLFAEMYGLEVNIFSSWRVRRMGDLDVNFMLVNSKLIEGIPCYPLQLCLDWKKEVGRAKDLDDIMIIEEALSGN